MKRWWWHCHRWGFLAYEGARERGEKVAYGMAYAYFVDVNSPTWNGKNAHTGPHDKERAGG